MIHHQIPIHPALLEHLEALASQAGDQAAAFLTPALAEAETGGAHGLSLQFAAIMREAGVSAAVLKGLAEAGGLRVIEAPRALWWLVLTTLIGLFHARIDEKAMRTINRGSGVLVAVFGLVVLIHLVSKFT